MLGRKSSSPVHSKMKNIEWRKGVFIDTTNIFLRRCSLPNPLFLWTQKRWIVIVIFLLLKLSAAVSQTLQSDLNYLLSKINFPQKTFNIKNESPPGALNLNEVSELKMLIFGTIWGYQTLISSQDASVCNFSPSCSRFSNEAFQRGGFIHGLLLTSDRLQRCNGLPDIVNNYQFLPGVGKFDDPLTRYLKPGLSPVAPNEDQ